MATALSTSANCKMDPTYFIADGNVVLRVETTLFKIHRSCLIQASTVFADMLSLPQGEQRVEGQDVAHPVVLAGDTADEFRSLCWAIYTRPDQLYLYLKDVRREEQCLRFLQIVILGHKYQCTSLVLWGLEMSSALCKLAGFRGSNDVVDALFRVHLCDIEGFDSWAEPFIKRLADSSQPQMLIRMMRAAVTATWKTLEYHTLYRLVSDGPNSWIGSAPDLTHDETFRLLRGYFNMNEFVYKLPTIDLPVEHQCPAGRSSQQCREEFTAAWRTAIKAVGVESAHDGSMNLLARLSAIRAMVDTTLSAPIQNIHNTGWRSESNHPAKKCKVHLLAAIQLLEDSVVEQCFAPDASIVDRRPLSPRVPHAYAVPPPFAVPPPAVRGTN